MNTASLKYYENIFDLLMNCIVIFHHMNIHDYADTNRDIYKKKYGAFYGLV